MALPVTPREAKGHKAKHLRNSGQVPMALIQKPDHEIRLIQGEAHAVRQTVGKASGVGMFDIQIEGEKKPRTVIVKQVDQDYLSHKIRNITLMEVSTSDTITTDILISHTGTPEAVDAGTALLNSPITHLKLKGKISALPDSIEIDISGLEVGGHVLASEVTLPNGVELLTPADTVLFSVNIAKEPELEVESGVEEVAEPAVVGEEGASEGGGESSE